jgi:hypothetical protein
MLAEQRRAEHLAHERSAGLTIALNVKDRAANRRNTTPTRILRADEHPGPQRAGLHEDRCQRRVLLALVGGERHRRERERERELRVLPLLLHLSPQATGGPGFRTTATALPITLSLARKVGGIISEVPSDVEQHPSFRFYM